MEEVYFIKKRRGRSIKATLFFRLVDTFRKKTLLSMRGRRKGVL